VYALPMASVGYTDTFATAPACTVLEAETSCEAPGSSEPAGSKQQRNSYVEYMVDYTPNGYTGVRDPRACLPERVVVSKSQVTSQKLRVTSHESPEVRDTGFIPGATVMGVEDTTSPLTLSSSVRAPARAPAHHAPRCTPAPAPRQRHCGKHRLPSIR